MTIFGFDVKHLYTIHTIHLNKLKLIIATSIQDMEIGTVGIA